MAALFISYVEHAPLYDDDPDRSNNVHDYGTSLTATRLPFFRHSRRFRTAWDAYLDGEEPTVLSLGESSTPSADVVYQITLQDPLVMVPVEVTDAGAYAVFLEHGHDEVSTALASPSGVVLVAAVEEEAEEEEGEEEDFGSATASKWANAIVASLIVSACRLVKIGLRAILLYLNKIRLCLG